MNKAEYHDQQEIADLLNRPLVEAAQARMDYERLWVTVKHLPRTKEDWLDLHATIESYKRRVVERHQQAQPTHEAR